MAKECEQNDIADLLTVYSNTKDKENYKDLPILDRMNIEAVALCKENVKRILTNYFFNSIEK